MIAALLAELRPELHRYCARMTGSVADGEDVVQDTLERALVADPPATAIELRRWLFRVAHNRMIDRARGYAQRMAEPLDVHADDAPAIDDVLAGAEAVCAALACFLELPPLPRSCVILKDVLGHSLDEIAADTELSVTAVKAALHRGRARLRALGAIGEPAAGTPSPVIARYAELFNAHDWDGVRALLADDVRLDVKTRIRRSGRGEVGLYFTNYDTFFDWTLVPVWLDGREVLAGVRDGVPFYFVELGVAGELVDSIRDFYHLSYIVRDARFVSA